VTAAVPITIELGPWLHGLGSPSHARIAERVSFDVAGLLTELGLAGDPAVKVTETAIARPVRVWVNGQVQRFTGDALRRAWVDAAPDDATILYDDDEDLFRVETGPPTSGGFPADLLARARERRDPRRFADTAVLAVAGLARAIVARRPGCLVGPGQAEALAGAAAADQPMPSTKAVMAILAGAIDSGVSVRSPEVVLETIAEGQRAGRDIDDIREAVRRRGRSDTVELHIAPEFAEELLGGTPLVEPRSALNEQLPESASAPFALVRSLIELAPGLPCPDPVWVPSEDVPLGTIAVRINGALSPAIPIPDAGRRLASTTPDRLRAVGVEPERIYPMFDMAACFVSADDVEDLNRAWIAALTGPEVAAEVFAAAVTSRAAQLFTIAESEQLIAQLATYYPELVSDVLDRYLLHDLTQILRRLIEGGATIHSLRPILQRLVIHDDVELPVAPAQVLLADALPRLPAGGDAESDRLERATAFVRLELGDALLPGAVSPGIPLVVLQLPELELSADEDACDALLDRVWQRVLDPRLRTIRPIAVCDVASRPAIRALLATELPGISVLAEPELPPSRTVVQLDEEDRDMAAIESVTRARVETMLARLVGQVATDEDGDLVIDHAGVRAYVTVVRLDSIVLLRIFAFSNREVPTSPELYRWAAMAPQYVEFARAALIEREGADTADVVISYELLGNYLDQGELDIAVERVLSVATRVATDVQAQFGGTSLVIPRG
jgi:hypothetical protein